MMDSLEMRVTAGLPLAKHLLRGVSASLSICCGALNKDKDEME